MLEIELSKDIEARLAKIADATGRSLAACAAEAIERYVESPSPQRITYGERIIVHMLARKIHRDGIGFGELVILE